VLKHAVENKTYQMLNRCVDGIVKYFHQCSRNEKKFNGYSDDENKERPLEKISHLGSHS
jgi:hypothetical protein